MSNKYAVRKGVRILNDNEMRVAGIVEWMQSGWSNANGIPRRYVALNESVEGFVFVL